MSNERYIWRKGVPGSDWGAAVVVDQTEDHTVSYHLTDHDAATVCNALNGITISREDLEDAIDLIEGDVETFSECESEASIYAKQLLPRLKSALEKQE